MAASDSKNNHTIASTRLLPALAVAPPSSSSLSTSSTGTGPSSTRTKHRWNHHRDTRGGGRHQALEKEEKEFRGVGIQQPTTSSRAADPTKPSTISRFGSHIFFNRRPLDVLKPKSSLIASLTSSSSSSSSSSSLSTSTSTDEPRRFWLPRRPSNLEKGESSKSNDLPRKPGLSSKEVVALRPAPLTSAGIPSSSHNEPTHDWKPLNSRPSTNAYDGHHLQSIKKKKTKKSHEEAMSIHAGVHRKSLEEVQPSNGDLSGAVEPQKLVIQPPRLSALSTCHSEATPALSYPSQPYSPMYVLKHSGDELTDLEKDEILQYEKIYFYSTKKVKSRRLNGRICTPEEIAVFGSSSSSSRLSNISEDNDGNSDHVQLFNNGYDDERGDYLVLEKDHLAFRYEVLHQLGNGSFGQVVCCFDHQTQQKVAIKIIRNRQKYRQQSVLEVQILLQMQRSRIQLNEDAPTPRIVSMEEYFMFRNHLCIVFELLGMNLYDHLKLRYFQGLALPNVRTIAVQLLETLAFLRTQHVIHCDLKPENILIRSSVHQEVTSASALTHEPIETVCLIDFGSSCFEATTVYTYIQSRFYRSPEVILGHEYSAAIDMWSLACLLVELFTGHPIFAGENETEQLACIMEFIGIPPSDFLMKCKRRSHFFDEVHIADTTVMSPATTTCLIPKPFVNSRGRKRVAGSRNLEHLLKTDNTEFVAFLQKCFVWDPSDRLTPEQALHELWIVGESQ